MNDRRLIESLAQLWFCSFLALLAFGCAQEMSPTGGKADREPPKIRSTFPPEGSTGFRGNEIRLDFDEYLQAGSFSNVVISPSPEQAPLYQIKGKSLILRFKESLQDSLTYQIYFDEEIKDNNEGNVLKDYTFAFSTGNSLDTGTIGGQLLDALSGKGVSRAWIGLYKSDTSVRSSKPDFICRSDGNGKFRFRYVKEGPYFLRAFTDDDYSLSWNQTSEKLAFRSNPIIIDADTVKQERLYMFRQEAKVQALQSAQCGFPFMLQLKLNKFSSGGNFRTFPETPFSTWFTDENRDSALIFLHKPDTTRILLIYAENGLEDSLRVECKKTACVKDSVTTYNVQNIDNQLLTNKNREKSALLSINQASGEWIKISFPAPLAGINISERAEFLLDSVRNFKPDSVLISADDPRILLLKFPAYQERKLWGWLPEQSLQFADGRTNAAFRIQISSPEEDNRGSLEIALSSDSGYTGPVRVKLLNSEGKEVMRFFSKSMPCRFSSVLLTQGDYKAEILLDYNGNQRYDSGDFEQARQPEINYFPPEKLSVKAGWQQEAKINITIIR